MSIWVVIEFGSIIPAEDNDLENYPVAEILLSKAFKTRIAAQQWIDHQPNGAWLEPYRLFIQE